MRFSMLVLISVALVCSTTVAQQLIREGDMEKLVLSTGADAEGWYKAEATMTPCAEVARGDVPSHQFHIDVDFHAGEEAYPIGWPRTGFYIKDEALQDWSAFDLLRYWVYTDTSRDELPTSALGMVLRSGDRSNSFSTNVAGLKKGEWVMYQIPVADIPVRSEVTAFQLYISESAYKDQDVVDFYVGDICLLRYAQPHILDAALSPPVVYSDAASFVVEFRASGINPAATVRARVAVVQDGGELLCVTRDVRRGANAVPFSLVGSDLPVGDYEVRIQLDGGSSKQFALKVIESPWQ